MKVSSKAAYFAGVMSYILIIVVGICYKGFTANKGITYNITLLMTVATLYAIIYSVEDIFLLCTIAKFVKPDIQSFADGIRGMVRMIGCTTGCLSVPLFVEHKNSFYYSLLTLLIISITLMAVRRKTLKNPQTVV